MAKKTAAPTLPEAPPKNLAQLKKHMKVGTRVRLIYRAHTGGAMDEARTVGHASAKEIAFIPDGKEQNNLHWMRWESAQSYKFTEDGFEVHAVDRPCNQEPFLMVAYQYI